MTWLGTRRYLKPYSNDVNRSYFEQLAHREILCLALKLSPSSSGSSRTRSATTREPVETQPPLLVAKPVNQTNRCLQIILVEAEKSSEQVFALDSYCNLAVNTEVHAAAACQSQFERILGNSEIALISVNRAGLHLRVWHQSIPSPI